MVEGIFIVGWRSDSGAFIVDQYPKLDIDDHDVMNLFNLHRMNNFKDPNFNYLRSKYYTLASWYSGFNDVDYIAKPNYCVGLYLSTDENPNQYEHVLKIITNNVLLHLNDSDLETQLFNILDLLTAGLYDNIKLEERGGQKTITEIKKIDAIRRDSPSQSPAKEEDPFGDILALTEEMDSLGKSSVQAKSGPSGSPFGSSSGSPFGSSQPSASPFGSSQASPFGSSQPSASPFGGSSAPSTPAKSLQPIAQGQASKETNIEYIIGELNRLDSMIPKSAGSTDREAYFAFLEKKVNILEQKIGVMNILIKNVQMKDVEIAQKNELIKKLIALLR